MLDILIKWPDRTVENLRLDPVESWVGSDPSCELALRGSGLEGRHFVFRPVPEGYGLITARDAGSVRINGKEKRKHLLEAGDRIEAPGVVLEIVEVWKGETGPSGGPDHTRLVVEVPGRERVEYELTKPRIEIGRDPECDVVVPDPQLLRRHVVLTRTENGILLTKLPGPSPVRVNGNLTAGRILNHGDEIELGRSVISFVSNRPAFKTMADLVYATRAESVDGGTRSEADEGPGSTEDLDPEGLLEAFDAAEEGFQSRLDFPEGPGAMSPDNPLRYLLTPEEEDDDALTDPDPYAELDPFEKAYQESHKYYTSFSPDQRSTWLGGSVNFKSWVTQAQRTLTSQRSMRSPFPKGVLLLGPPGTGKKLAVEAMSYLWKIPIVRIDLEAVFAEPARDWVDTIAGVMSSLASTGPRIVHLADIDESIERLYEEPSRHVEIVSFYNTLIRCFRDEENSSGLFPAFTGSQLRWMHRDLLRRGHVVEEIFFVDIPDSRTRGEILTVLLYREGEKPERFDLRKLTHLTRGLTGRELGQLISVAKSISKAENLTNEVLEIVALRHAPESMTPRDLNELRAAAKKLCVPA